MLDFILGLFLAALLIRGWMRGLVREALDLAGLVLGVFIAFRLSGPFGEFLINAFGVSPEVATIGGGILLFILFGVALSIAAHYLTRLMNLPGLSTVNRVGGAAVATAWGIVLLLVVINIARVLPLPESWEQGLEDSTVVTIIAGPEAVPQQMLETVGGDRVLASLAVIRSLFDSARVVPEGQEVVEVPSARRDEIRQVRDEVDDIAARINELRVGNGLQALAVSDGFKRVAEDRAEAMYRSGRISRATPPGGGVAGDLRDAGLTFAVAGENLGLASSSNAALQGMVESTSGLAQFSIGAYDRMGISVVDGPTGVLVVVVLGG